MKREIIAAALLLLLLTASLVNIAYLDRMREEIEKELQSAMELAAAGQFSAATAALDRAIARWVGAEAYTHIFLRHAEVDACSDAFFEARQLLAEQNAEGFPSAFDKLNYHLTSLDEMEHIRLGSIL